MPNAEYVAANKATSEARKLLLRLQLTGHSTADIARAIGTESAKLRDIRKGATRGDALIVPLQRLMATMAPTTPTPAGESAAAARDMAPMGGATGGERGEASPLVVAPAPVGGSLPADLDAVEAPETPTTEAPGLAARLKALMLGGGGDAAPSAPVAPRASGKGKSELQAQFVGQVLPVLALLVTWGSELAIRDPYKPVAPSAQEASAMLAVPVRRLARELDIRHKLTEGTMDMVLMLLAVAAYGRRARATYTHIRSEHATQETQRASSGAGRDTGGVPLGPHGPNGRHADPAATGHADAGGAGVSAGEPGRRGLFGRRDGRSADGGDAGPTRAAAARSASGGAGRDARSGPDPLNELLELDYAGRLQLGMVG